MSTHIDPRQRPIHEDLWIENIAPSELSEIAEFLNEQIRAMRGDAPAVTTSAETLRWYLLENPARREDISEGWIVRANGGRVVGVCLNSPQRFRYHDDDYLVSISGPYYVDKAYQGQAVGILRNFVELGQRYPCMGTGMNVASGAVIAKVGAYPIPHTDHEMLGIVCWGPVLEEWLHQRTGSAALARPLGRLGTLRPSALRRHAGGRLRGELAAVETAEEAGRIEFTTRTEQLTAVRDGAFLRWRYFGGPTDSRRLFTYRDENGGDCLVGVAQRPWGYRGQVRALMVLDVFGAMPTGTIAEVGAQLAAAYADEIDLVAFPGQPPERQRELSQEGFLHRTLAGSAGFCLDVNDVLPTRDWYLVPADGDP